MRMLKGTTLVRATKPFAREQSGRSWWHLWSTMAIIVAGLSLAAAPLPWWARLGPAVIAGLAICRFFILYHDQQHGAILRGSVVADKIMWLYGVLTLNPPSTWNRSHNHHHKNNAKIRGASIGSFPVMTVAGYRRASRRERIAYAAARHPLTILFAWVTVILYGMTLQSLISEPREHKDCVAALAFHIAIWVVLGIFAPAALLWCFVIPCGIASALGAYLFYAQH